MSKCPCKDCVPPERHEACWDHCDKYKEWKKPIVDSYEERIKAVDRRMINDRMYSVMDRRAKQDMKRR